MANVVSGIPDGCIPRFRFATCSPKNFRLWQLAGAECLIGREFAAQIQYCPRVNHEFARNETFAMEMCVHDDT
jgi:hypothetical protein